VLSKFRRAAFAAVVVSLAMPGAGFSQTGAGAYLAGRQAISSSDFEAAARYFTRALGQDPGNPALMESVALSQLSLGRIDQALPIARFMEDMGLKSQVAHMVVTASLIAAGEFDTLLARDSNALGIGPLVDGLVKAWASIGAGSMAQALTQFDAVAEQGGLRSFARYQKALALASVGDFEGAEATFADDSGGALALSRGAVVARMQILSQLDRNNEALAMLEATFDAGLDAGLRDLRDRLVAGETLPFDHVRSVSDGMAEVFYSIGQALEGDAADEYVLIYARLATFLRPDHEEALLLGAQLLSNLGQFDLAVETYRKVPRSSPDFYPAELGRAEALRQAAKPDAAVEVLEQLARDNPDLPRAYTALGDLLRQQEDYAAAVKAYDKALELTDPASRSQWFLLYARGIAHERLKQWDKAEADFRSALALNPDQPQVLNYLGYSLVERQVKLDEALAMIERAVARRPESGYIVDSLGWVLFRMGRYDEAVAHMENAVELVPVDPVVNDHLGDVYWAVGRKREAEFQWRRALSFIDPETSDGEADPVRIRRKLEIGLSAVLAEEGAPPLKLANDDG
jgi:tetratricopeptide (TPR) repeat protein